MDSGFVIKTTGSWHTVRSGDTRINCRLKGAFRTHNLKNTNPVAVGDQVIFETSGDDTGVITEIKERRNYIIRKSTNLSREVQIMAANIDQCLLMFTIAFPETPLEFIDRFLVCAEAFHINTIIFINKTDLYNEVQLNKMAETIGIYEYAGYTVVSGSVTDKVNIDKIQALIKDKLTLLAGNSGIGKSSLINTLCPGLNLKTSEISRYHLSGKHTTTYPEMIELSKNTWVIDSPGIRGFGITDLEQNEIGLYFSDIFKLSKNCQFYNCTHIHEPNCAVIEAVQSGLLHESRYKSYFNIFNDSDQKYRLG